MTEYLGQLLAETAARVPTINRVLALQGEDTLQRYVDSLTQTDLKPYQPVDDVADAAADYCSGLLGDEIADQLRQDIKASPLVLTANHHGVDFFAQSVQGSLCLGLRQIDGRQARTIPVFACGSIAMNNLTYPRGALIYQTDPQISPVRVPLFPDRLKRQMVARTQACTEPMLQRAVKRGNGLRDEGAITGRIAETLQGVLQDCYGHESVQQLNDYSDQAVRINNMLWQKMFANQCVGQLVYLELEKLVQPLLIADLSDERSLLSLMMFDEQVRVELIERLKGAKGCWHYVELFKQLYDQEHIDPGAGNGTFMFWGIDSRNRRFALGVDRKEGQYVLRAIDAGLDWTLSLTPDAIQDALRNGEILPSLFTCYSVISLARGIVCAGGYYQAEYLPHIQQGVVRALSVKDQLKPVAEAVAGIRTDAYLSGMQAVMCQHEDGLLPAGPLEIIAAGGLDARALQNIAKIRVRDAHIASLRETIPDIFGSEADICWQRLARENGVLLKSEAVIVQ